MINLLSIVSIMSPRSIALLENHVAPSADDLPYGMFL